jgi:hypothetical protein
MNITRIGLVTLIVGLILLMNASSSHVSGYTTLTYGALGQNETETYVLLIGPVGPTTLAIGGADYKPIYSTPAGVGGSTVVANVSVHMKVTDPENNTLAEQDVMTPYLLDLDLKSRGAYTVYVTNKNTENSTIPLTVIFEIGNPENREADKFLVSLILTAAGVLILFAGLVISFPKQRKQQKLFSEV